MLKFSFSIRTRTGLKVDRIVIGGQDHDEAERRLRQMYRQCDVLCCTVRHPDGTTAQINAMEHALEPMLR
jgi:hypothetical protein